MKFLTSTYLIFFIIFLWLIFMFIFISKFDLWYDEVYSVFISYKWLRFFLNKSAGSNLPFYPFLTYIWLKIFNPTPFQVRLLPLLFGFLALLYFLKFLKNFFDSKSIPIFIFLFAFSPIFVYYSKELRYYSFLIFLFTILLNQLYYIEKKVKYLNLFFIHITLALTHFFGYLTIPFEILYLLFLYFLRKIELKKVILISLIITVPPSLIFYFIALSPTKDVTMKSTWWIPKPKIWDLFFLYKNLWFGYGLNKALSLIGFLIGSFLTLWAVLKNKFHFLFFLTCLIILSPLVVFFASIILPNSIFLARYFTIFFPSFFLLIALGIHSLNSNFKIPIIILILFLFVISNYNQFIDNFPFPRSHPGVRFHKDYTSMLLDIGKVYKNNVLIVHTCADTMVPFYNYYAPFLNNKMLGITELDIFHLYQRYPFHNLPDVMPELAREPIWELINSNNYIILLLSCYYGGDINAVYAYEILEILDRAYKKIFQVSGKGYTIIAYQK